MRYAICAADTFSLGVGYLISHLRADGNEVKLIFDPLQHSRGGTRSTWLSRIFSVEDYNVKQLLAFNPDACLFSCMTAHYQWALRMAKRVKKEVGCKIIFGGVHVTSVPDIVSSNSFVDDICVGDGIRYFGLEFKPDEIFPAWQDFFSELPAFHRTHPFMMTSFGCPFSCTYCQPRELKIKAPRRSIEGCIKELLELKKLGAKRFSIWDDAFSRDERWLMEFLTAYKARVRLPFRCLTHPKLMNDKIALALKLAGCYTIDMGIQTGNEELRKAVLNRRETNKEFLNACRVIKDRGIKLVVDHIFEIPRETDDTNRESYLLYKEAKPDLVHCFKLLYFPRAEIIRYAYEEGMLDDKAVDAINQGKHTLYASGENQRVAKINPWVKRMLAIPLGGGLWEKMPDWFIKLACYIRIGEDFLPQVIIKNQIYFTLKRFTKW